MSNKQASTQSRTANKAASKAPKDHGAAAEQMVAQALDRGIDPWAIIMLLAGYVRAMERHARCLYTTRLVNAALGATERLASGPFDFDSVEHWTLLGIVKDGMDTPVQREASVLLEAAMWLRRFTQEDPGRELFEARCYIERAAAEVARGVHGRAEGHLWLRREYLTTVVTRAAARGDFTAQLRADLDALTAEVSRVA